MNYKATNTAAKIFLLMDTVKAVLMALIFSLMGIGAVYLGYAHTPVEQRTIPIIVGSLFFLIGIGIGIMQVFEFRQVRSGPPGTATKWLENRTERQRAERPRSRYGGKRIRFG